MSRPQDGHSEVRAAAQAQGLADLLRSLPESRLRRVASDGSVADGGRRIAQLLADTAAGVVQRDAPAPTRRQVPDLGPFAVPDQIAVTATDLQEAAGGLDPQTPVWAPDGARSTLDAVLGRAASEITALTASA